MEKNYQKRNYAGFLIHALFLALTMNFIDVNTVVPNMLGELGGSAFHLGLLSAIMIGGSSFMQLIFAGMIIPLRRKKPALLTGIYLRVTSLMALGLFLLDLESDSSWKLWAVILLMALFSFSGSFANISYTDVMGRAIQPEKRKTLLMNKQLISSVGVIVSSLLVKLILTRYSYPLSYSVLFILGSSILLLGTIGFWIIREPLNATAADRKGPKRVALFVRALKEDRNLRHYLLWINTSGVILSTIPFLILFGRSRFEITGGDTGTFLLFQMGGALAANILLNLIPKREHYRPLLNLFILLAAVTPIAALVLVSSVKSYMFLFLLTGASMELFKIVQPGILLEISNDENRTVYAGLSGAGSVMNIIFPIAAGAVIPLIGFEGVFILTSLYILSGFFAARNIVCLRFRNR